MLSNRAENVEKIILESCNNITGQVGHMLLDLPNNLKHLHLKDCMEITRRDFETYQKDANLK